MYLEPHNLVYMGLPTPAMGMSWSLYFVRWVASKAMVETMEHTGISPPAAARQLLFDGRPPPQILPGCPATAVHVDNFHWRCWDTDDTNLVVPDLLDLLQSHGVRFRIECEGHLAFEMVGLHVDLSRLVITSQPKKRVGVFEAPCWQQ